jgi:hypothetical protein
MKTLPMNNAPDPIGIALGLFHAHFNQAQPDGTIGCRDPHCRPFFTGEDPDEQGRYICPCGTSLKNPTTWRRHLREIHGAKKCVPKPKRRRWRKYTRHGELRARR